MASSLAKMLECPVCFEKMCLPKQLPCGHTFCIVCLNKIAEEKQRNQINCPNCRKTHNLPKNGVNGFNNNYTLLELISLNLDSSRSLLFPSQNNVNSTVLSDNSSKLLQTNQAHLALREGQRPSTKPSIRPTTGYNTVHTLQNASLQAQNEAHLTQLEALRKNPMPSTRLSTRPSTRPNTRPTTRHNTMTIDVSIRQPNQNTPLQRDWTRKAFRGRSTSRPTTGYNNTHTQLNVSIRQPDQNTPLLPTHVNTTQSSREEIFCKDVSIFIFVVIFFTLLGC